MAESIKECYNDKDSSFTIGVTVDVDGCWINENTQAPEESYDMANKTSGLNGNTMKMNRTENVSCLRSVRMEEEDSEKISGSSELIIYMTNFLLINIFRSEMSFVCG